MSKIQAAVVADSTSRGHRLTTMEIILPRIILAEKNTHRALSKNLSSSRAIPFKRMLRTILEDPFIPIAFQKEHTGMQGTKYHNPEAKFHINDAVAHIYKELIIGEANTQGDKEYNAQIMKLVSNLAIRTYPMENTLVGWWLEFRDMAAMCATLLYSFKATKQLANRLLEPFMWAKALVSGTDEGWQNFFNLRCPQYSLRDKNNEERVYRSRKDAVGSDDKPMCMVPLNDTLGWLQLNKGQAEIHMMALAEAIWDAMNESTPKKLKAGEWHIPYLAAFQQDALNEGYSEQGMIKIATGMSAITSYTVVGDEKEKPYQTLIGIHDKMIVANPFHASPFEHCAQVPTEEEYYFNMRTRIPAPNEPKPEIYDMTKGYNDTKEIGVIEEYGWFRNYHGFKQYRQIIEDDKSNR